MTNSKSVDDNHFMTKKDFTTFTMSIDTANSWIDCMKLVTREAIPDVTSLTNNK